jgi:2-polyprenyl-6-methoxyphenol hydroxylase-like FAD-dependent oxidoreductase
VDAAIFGAGIAGLMAAITLRSSGHRSRIYERSRLNHESGMGFILVPECIEFLQSFGVAISGLPLERYCFRDAAGRILHEQTMPAGTRGIRRRDLMAALLCALPADEAPTFDAELNSLQLDAEGAVRKAHLRSGERTLSIQADLYVAADGIRSRGRQALFPGWPLAQAQVQEVVGLVRSSKTIRWAAANFNKFHAAGGGIAVGVLPVDAEHVIWYLQFDARRFPPPQENAEACCDFVTRLVGDWADPIPHLLAHTDFSGAHLWLPVDADLVPRFNQGNLVLVGDAAHPLLPFTSQGVASAVADAVALANALNTASDITGALANYSIERHKKCSPFIVKGRELMRHFLEPQGAFTELPIAWSSGQGANA